MLREPEWFKRWWLPIAILAGTLIGILLPMLP